MARTYFERFLDPWREFDQMNRMFNREMSDRSSKFPAVNVWVNGDDAVVSSEIPGINVDNLDISISGNTVTLKGERETGESNKDSSFHRHELWHGAFSKTIKLPFNIDAENVRASYKKGVLEVTLPQLESDKPRKIKIS